MVANLCCKDLEAREREQGRGRGSNGVPTSKAGFTTFFGCNSFWLQIQALYCYLMLSKTGKNSQSVLDGCTVVCTESLLPVSPNVHLCTPTALRRSSNKIMAWVIKGETVAVEHLVVHLRLSCCSVDWSAPSRPQSEVGGVCYIL